MFSISNRSKCERIDTFCPSFVQLQHFLSQDYVINVLFKFSNSCRCSTTHPPRRRTLPRSNSSTVHAFSSLIVCHGILRREGRQTLNRLPFTTRCRKRPQGLSATMSAQRMLPVLQKHSISSVCTPSSKSSGLRPCCP